MSPDEPLRYLALGGSAALGLVVGSFLNVVIHRLPAGKSVVTPRSACPDCSRPIPWHENVPVLSWILLRGRCAGCHAGISPRYAVVELLTGGLVVLAAWLLVVRPAGGVRDARAWMHFAAGVPFLGALVAASFIDLDLRILPDRITKRGMVAGPVLSALVAPGMQPVHWLPGLPPHGAALLLSVAGVLLGWGLLRAVAWAGEKAFRKEAMGMGDAKFMGMIGGFVGPLAVIWVLMIASLLGSVVGMAVLVVRREREIPFGPFLAAGAIAVFLAGERIREFVAALLAPA